MREVEEDLNNSRVPIFMAGEYQWYKNVHTRQSDVWI
jgi:hypothetical protein